MKNSCKIHLVIFGWLLLNGLPIFGQSVLIPYKQGDKFGLCDEAAKIVVQPTYNNISYLKDFYFQYTNTTMVADTLKKMSGELLIKQIEKKETGVFYKNKLLIAHQPFKHFLIYKQCIVGSINPYHPEKCTLFNFRGEQLIKETIKGLGIGDSRDFGAFTASNNNATLIAIFQQDEYRKKVYSIAVLDHKSQKIIKWLLYKVSDFQLIKNETYNEKATCIYNDSNGLQRKHLLLINNAYSLINAKPKESAQKSIRDETMVQEVTMESIYDVAVPPVEDMPLLQTAPISLTDEEQEKRGYIFYHLQKDTLFYIKQQGKQAVDFKNSIDTLIFIYPNNVIQKESIIYKKDNKFGLISRGVLQPTIYDALFYNGENYIAYKKIGNQQKCGLLDYLGREKVPFIYDSIVPFFKKFTFDGLDNYQSKAYNFIVKENDENSYSYSSSTKKVNVFVKRSAAILQVFNDNKSGLIQSDSSIILLPVEYDLIAQNGLRYSDIDEFNFYLLKKNNLYGISEIKYSYTNKKLTVNQLVQPCFTYIPCYIKNDYYEQKGLQLFALFNDKYIFKGFANKKGFLYASE
jgi:hypothetical protein